MLQISLYETVTRFDLARTFLGRGRYWTTAYSIDGLLIDSGCAHTGGELVEHFRADPPIRILNTHSHEDHIGANGPLQVLYPELEILAHPLALPVLADPWKTQPLQPYRRLFWGWPEPSMAQPVENGESISTGRYTFEVIYTPGHSPDHICLFERERGWLFTGDLLVGGKDKALREGYDIWRILNSLKLVSQLPIQRIFPGSARVPADPVQALQGKISYLEELGEQIQNFRQCGWGAGRIASRLLGKPMWVEIVTLGHFSRRNLVRSFLREGGDVTSIAS